MSKKKLLSLTFLGIFALYLISCFFIYILAFENNSESFNNYAQMQYDNLIDTIEKAESVEMIKFDLLQFRAPYPAGFCLIESGGEVIAQSTPAFCVDRCNENGEYINSFIIDAEKYITDDISAKLSEFTEGYVGSPFRLNLLSVCEEDGEYIPVKGVFYKTWSYDPTALEITFTDKEPDFTVYENDGSIITLSRYQIYSNKVYRKYSDKIKKIIKDRIDTFQHSDPGGDYNGGSGFIESGLFQHEDYFKKDGKKYSFYFDTRFSIPYDTIHNSALFKDSFKDLTIVLIIITVLLLVIISKLVDKNERLNKSREAFVAAAAHELKTPLAVITNKCECILEDTSPEVNKEYVNSIYDESKRMSRMVKTLLQYNNLSLNTKISKTKVPLGEVTAKCAADYRPLAEANGMTLTEETEDDLVLKCSREHIALVIDNFLSNAIKFASEGGEVRITAKKIAGIITVEVFNSGSEISKADAPHIWDELYCGDSARTRAGNSTGMGLSICRAVLRLHGFNYGFRNENGGVTFYFTGQGA